jgi:hypothetical protein
MNDSNKNRKYQTYSIISLIIAVFSFALLITIYFSGSYIRWYGNYVFLLIAFTSGIISIIGICLGVKGKNLLHRNVAIAGIIICTFCLISWVFESIMFIGAILWGSL